MQCTYFQLSESKRWNYSPLFVLVAKPSEAGNEARNLT